MADTTLVKRSFTEDCLGSVSAFRCGDSAWTSEACAWIKTPPGHDVKPEDSALASIEAWNTRVWLYLLPGERLVGFGGVGVSKWRIPRKDSEYVSVSILPWWAIAEEFQGKPDNVNCEDRYSSLILGDLINEARSNWLEGRSSNYFALCVSVENLRARSCYRKAGFQEMTFRHKGLIKMVLDLDQNPELHGQRRLA